jgi:hypothetical protein
MVQGQHSPECGGDDDWSACDPYCELRALSQEWREPWPKQRVLGRISAAVGGLVHSGHCEWPGISLHSAQGACRFRGCRDGDGLASCMLLPKISSTEDGGTRLAVEV